jgi:hypothetical protein
MVAEVMSGHGLSQRRACRLIGITRRSLRRVPDADRNVELRHLGGGTAAPGFADAASATGGAKASQLITTPIDYITPTSLTCDWSTEWEKAISASDKASGSGTRHSARLLEPVENSQTSSWSVIPFMFEDLPYSG